RIVADNGDAVRPQHLLDPPHRGERQPVPAAERGRARDPPTRGEVAVEPSRVEPEPQHERDRRPGRRRPERRRRRRSRRGDECGHGPGHDSQPHVGGAPQAKLERIESTTWKAGNGDDPLCSLSLVIASTTTVAAPLRAAMNANSICCEGLGGWSTVAWN